MKPETTLVELLKPPFKYDEWKIAVIDGNNEIICSINHKKWPYKYELLGSFVAQALNEKWERDLGGPVRWEFSDLNSEIHCPMPECRKSAFFSKYLNPKSRVFI